MPAKSAKQRRAMFAAAEGKSTLGIPKAVGREFVDATPPLAPLPRATHIHIHLPGSGKAADGTKSTGY